MLALIKTGILLVLGFVIAAIVIGTLLAFGLGLLSIAVRPFHADRSARVAIYREAVWRFTERRFRDAFKIVIVGVVLYLFILFFIGT